MPSEVRFCKAGRIALAVLNNPPLNVLSRAVRAGLLDAVDRALTDPEVAALVIQGDGTTFCAGADIREFRMPLEPPMIHEVLSRLEGSSKPVIAAIHGTALGGGLELALGCHYRIAVDTARLRFPEVTLGIIPGAGGTQRLPRLIGVEKGLELIVEGREIGAAEALSLGAIDALIEGELASGALTFAQKLVAEGATLRRVRDLQAKPADLAIFEQMRRTVERRQRGFLAPLKAIEAVRAAVELPFDEGLLREREICRQLLASPQAKAQRHVFALERTVAKVSGLPPDTPLRPIERAAVVGAGTMGTGIAVCFANAGIPVALLDRKPSNLERALKIIREGYAASLARGSLAAAEIERRLERIRTTTNYADLAQADIVIESVAEDLEAKKSVFTALDQACHPGAILATNTSFLDLNEIASATRRPQDVLGMHFFNPAHVMRLLENVRGGSTAPDVLGTAMQLGRRLGKIAVLVGACDGFVGNRMLSRRTRESLFMLEEGALPWQIDAALVDFGFPLGPFAVNDLGGIDVVLATRKARFTRLSEREKACTLLDKLVEMGRLGRKTGAGWYRYDDKRQALPDPAVEQLILAHSAERGFTRRDIEPEEILERCLYAMVNEGANLIEGGVVLRPDEIDAVWVFGLGFPQYRGGPMFHADTVGLDNVRVALERYRKRVGDEFFAPSPLIERLARAGKGFYGS
jgi:3-hydroxyacyl-CoA dehydrogenase